MAIVIETPRTILRHFTEEDLDAVFEFNSHPEVQRYTGEKAITEMSQALHIINKVTKVDYDTYGYGRFATVYKPENKVIGFAGLKYEPTLGETDIGFRFLPAYWGKGLATEVSIELIKYGFDTLNLERIIGIAMPENIGSCKVLQKIGLQLYKVGEFDGDGGNYNWYKMEKAAFLEKATT